MGVSVLAHLRYEYPPNHIGLNSNQYIEKNSNSYISFSFLKPTVPLSFPYKLHCHGAAQLELKLH